MDRNRRPTPRYAPGNQPPVTTPLHPLHPPMQASPVRQDHPHHIPPVIAHPHHHLRTNHPAPDHPLPSPYHPSHRFPSPSSEPDAPRHQPHAYTYPPSSFSAEITSQPLQLPVADGGIAKPKKLHREVEQKRRMRMTQQIAQLRQWVSNPNGGRTDKVSVLQDTVAYVKDAATKIQDLQTALHHSKAECDHLRSLLNNSSSLLPMSKNPSRLATSQSDVASVPHPSVDASRHPPGSLLQNVVGQAPVQTAVPTPFSSSRLPPAPNSSHSQPPTQRPATGHSNYAGVDSGPPVSIRQKEHPNRRNSQEGPNPDGFPDSAGNIALQSLPLPRLHNQRGMYADHRYGTMHAASTAMPAPTRSSPPQRDERGMQRLYERRRLPLPDAKHEKGTSEKHRPER